MAAADVDKYRHPFYAGPGGSIGAHFTMVLPQLCDTMHWAKQAMDPTERPPLANQLRLVKLSIVDPDGTTVGSATYFPDDGRDLYKVHQTLGCILGAG